MKLLNPGGPSAMAPPPPPSPTSADPATAAATQKAQADAAAAQRNARGRASTLLTGGQGDTSLAPTSKNVLLSG